MDTLKDYNKAVEDAKKRVVKLLKGMKENKMSQVAVNCGVSFGLVSMYKAGKGTNLETMLNIIEAVEKINNEKD